MSNSNDAKSARHKLIDPRMGQITKQNAMIPGGPDTNTPYTSLQSEGAPVNSVSIYGDHPQNDVIYPQIGTRSINPTNVPPGKLPQSNAPGQRLNAQPFNTQQQFDLSGRSPIADMQETSRLAMNAQKELPKGGMGLQGVPAIPGGLPGDMPGTSGPQLMPGNPGMSMQAMNPDAGAMVPGSTPQKKGQKKRGKK